MGTEPGCALHHPDLRTPPGTWARPSPECEQYLVRRSRTCCLRLGMVARASTMVQAAWRAACVAGVKSTCGTQARSPVSGDGWSCQVPSRAQSTATLPEGLWAPLRGKVKGEKHQLMPDATVAAREPPISWKVVPSSNLEKPPMMTELRKQASKYFPRHKLLLTLF